jgi:protein-tyrosine phosphatase
LAVHYWVIEGQLAGRAGPRCVPWELRELREEGVAGIVSLDAGVNSSDVEKAGLKHLRAFMPMVFLEREEDHLEFLTVLPSVVKFIDEIRAQNGAALVHCHYGCDRTGCVLGCYLVAREGFSPAQAYHHIRERNPNAFGASGYAEAILTFDKLFKEQPDWLERTP